MARDIGNLSATTIALVPQGITLRSRLTPGVNVAQLVTRQIYGDRPQMGMAPSRGH